MNQGASSLLWGSGCLVTEREAIRQAIGLTTALHLAMLMVSTPPGRYWFQPVDVIYPVGIAMSVLVLVNVRTEERG